MDGKEGKIRVLMFPWLAYGHVSPFLELGKGLTERNFDIYFCSTPINLLYAKEKLKEEKYLESIQLVELHLPSLPDLPPHFHTTNGLPTNLMPTLKQALNMSTPAFSHILNTLKPDLLIYDCNQPWAPSMASSLNIPAVAFLPAGAATASFAFHMLTNPAKPYPYPQLHLRNFNASMVRGQPESGQSNQDVIFFLESLKSCSDVVLVKSSRAFEEKHIDYFSLTIGKKVLPVGPLVEESIVKEDDDWIFQWLDKKESSSTVFVCFGSECFLTAEEIEEVGLGLELSGVNFVWAIRVPAGEKERIPEGFVDRVGKRGIIVEGWAPQGRILAHGSIGGFVSHCGWSSVMESMSHGIPIIATPMQLDQPLNARVVEEVGVGVEVIREERGNLWGEEIGKVIRKVVVEKEGEEIRNRAKELRKSIRRKGEEEIDGVVEELALLCRRRKSSEK